MYGGTGDERKKSKTLQVIRRQDPLEEWDVTTHLGDGAFSQVFKVAEIVFSQECNLMLDAESSIFNCSNYPGTEDTF